MVGLVDGATLGGGVDKGGGVVAVGGGVEGSGETVGKLGGCAGAWPIAEGNRKPRQITKKGHDLEAMVEDGN